MIVIGWGSGSGTKKLLADWPFVKAIAFELQLLL
jgi:hypothetical protein